VQTPVLHPGQAPRALLKHHLQLAALTVLLSLCVPAAHSRYCSHASGCPAALPPPPLLLLLRPATGLLIDERLLRLLMLM
jgi:hypothetical protein